MAMKNNTLRKLYLCPMLVAMCAATVPVQAGMVDNTQLVQQQQDVQQRDSLRQVLAREDVRSALVAQGVDPASVDARVEHLTAAELQQINAGLADLPAGGDGVGLILGIIFIFIVLDLLGATDVFPRI